MGTSRSVSAANRRCLLDGSVAILLAAAAFALYVRTLAPTVLRGDGGEFQFVPYLLGVAHPTGYPLYLLLGWLWSHLLPLGDVAYRMNLFSAFWAALAVGLLYPTARALLRQAMPGMPALAERLLASLAAVLFAVTPTFWSQSIIAEVYPLHITFVILLFCLILTWGEQRAPLVTASGAAMKQPVLTGPKTASPAAAERNDGLGPAGGQKYLLLAAFVFGLSLAHHRTTVLLAPAILAYVWLVDRHLFRDLRFILGTAALTILPLLLYLYIPLRAPHTPYLHLSLTAGRELDLYDNTVPGFIRFILGGAFAGSLDFSVDLGARLALAWSFLRHEATWVGFALASAGVLGLAISRRWAVLALTGLTFVVSLAFNLVYTIGDVVVMFIPLFLIAALWAAVGVGILAQVVDRVGTGVLAWIRAGQWRESWAGGRWALVTMAIVLPVFALPAWLVAHNYASIDQSHNTSIRAGWQSILAEPLPDGAVLVSNDRNDIMPLWYFQYVGDGQPQRPDMLGLFPLITAQYPTLGPVLDLALGTGRPVYLIKQMPGVEIKVKVQAQDGLWRVAGPAAEDEPSFAVGGRLADAVTLVGYDLLPRSPRPGETLQVSLYWQAQRALPAKYHTFVHLLDAQGTKVSQSDHRPGGDYYPTTLWQPGERLRDDLSLAVPADTLPGIYRLVAGMYALDADGTLQPLGEPLPLGEVRIEAALPAFSGLSRPRRFGLLLQ